MIKKMLLVFLCLSLFLSIPCCKKKLPTSPNKNSANDRVFYRDPGINNFGRVVHSLMEHDKRNDNYNRPGRRNCLCKRHDGSESRRDDNLHFDGQE